MGYGIKFKLRDYFSEKYRLFSLKKSDTIRFFIQSRPEKFNSFFTEERVFKDLGMIGLGGRGPHGAI